jgi:peptidoglycan L-alanyl-D-glutamate endopeptidase CwlK
MPTFSESSKEELATCDPRLQTLFNIVILHFDCKVLEGYRSETRQLDLYERGLSQVKRGNHNYSPSRAVDVAPYPIDWADTARWYYFGGVVMGIAKILGLPIRWGGDWDGDTKVSDQGFNDLGHFEIKED